MAQAQTARFHDIIDLTGGDDDDDQYVILNAAASNAQAAVDRWNSQIESLASIPSRSSFANSCLESEKTSALSENVKPAPNGFRSDFSGRYPKDRDSRGSGELPARVPSSEPGRQTTNTGSRLGVVGQQRLLPNGEGLQDARIHQPTVRPSPNQSLNNEPSTARSPRAVARPAGRLITELFDTDQSTLETDQQPVRGQKRKRQSPPATSEPTPNHAQFSLDRYDSVYAPNHKRRSLSQAELPLLSKKSGTDGESTAKQTPQEGQSVAVLRTGAITPRTPATLLADKATKEATDRLKSLQPSPTQASSGAQKSAKPFETHHQTQAQAQAEAHTAALSKTFDDLVFPTIRKQKKRHRGILSDDELLSIGKQVATATVDQKLKLYPAGQLSQLAKSQRKEVKSFIKKTYRNKILSSPAVRAQDLSAKRENPQQSSSGDVQPINHVAAGNDNKDVPLPTSCPPYSIAASDNRQKQPPVPQGKITNLGEYLKKLENEVHSADLDSLENLSPVRAQAPPLSHDVMDSSSHGSSWQNPLTSVDQISDDLSENPKSLVVSLRISSNALLRSALHSITGDSSPPGFDRGRFPAQRRRRGNKYYNPERPLAASSSNQMKTQDSIYQPPVPEPKAVKPRELSKPGSGRQASEDSISQMLIARIATIPRVKSLAEAIASGKPSPEQETFWTEFTRELNRSKNSGTLSDFETWIINLEEEDEFLKGKAGSLEQPTTGSQVLEARTLATALDPHLERLVAKLVMSEHGKTPFTSQRSRDYVDNAEQQALLQQPTLLKYVERMPKSSFTRIETKIIDPVLRPERHHSSLLRHREIGANCRGRNVNTHRELRLRNAEKIEPWRSWKGASGDVVAVAWSSDSSTFAVGAAAHTNPEDVQYNRPCNLLLGELTSNTLTELPDHRIDRPKPETLANTYNARQAVYDACDPMVYETVSSIAFSPMADRMYTASYDHTVKIWDTKAPQTTCLGTLYHNANVTSVDASARIPGLFATASDVIDDSIRIYYTENLENSNPVYVGFSSSRAQGKQEWRISPECIRWGSTSHTSHLLLAGFRQRWTDDIGIPQQGHLCLWDVNTLESIKVMPFSQGVLAAAWHPVLPFFATGGAPGGNLTEKNTTKSVVRTWDLRNPTHYTMEYECSALDMQDITFHPTDSNIVTAGCTDGTSFVWDFRRPNRPLHRLKHGKPLVDWDHTHGRREQVDCGVMMSLWGLGGSLFYTGSSDGMIKAWDIRRHPQDVLQRNVAQFSAGIQSGAFSPDGTNLLVGDSDGGVHVLSSAPCGPQPNEDGTADVSPELPITLVRAPSGSGLALNSDDDDPGTEGREEAKRLTDSMQLLYDPELGVTQGIMYHGPYATHHRREAQSAEAECLQKQGDADIKQFFLRTPEDNQEVEGQRREFIAARKQRISELYPSSKAPQGEIANKSIPKKSIDRVGDRFSPYSSGSDVSVRSASSKGAKSSWSAAIPRPRLMPFIGKAFGLNDHNSLPDHRHSISPTESVEDYIIPESKMVEQNHWWPDLGRNEIERARAGRGHENFPG